MRYNYTLLLVLLLFSSYSSASFAQDYEIIEKYEVEANRDPHLHGVMIFKEYIRLGDYSDEFRKDEIYVFRKVNENGIFYFSAQEEIEGDKSWKIDISDSSNHKIGDEASYHVKRLTDKIVAILDFDTQAFNSYLFLIDIESKNVLSSFPLKTRPDLLSSFFENLQSDGQYIVFQDYKAQFVKEISESGIHDNTIKVYSEIEDFAVRNIQTTEVKEYHLDQTDYYTAKPRVLLLPLGEVKCIGLYSDEPQTGFYTTTESYQTYNPTPYMYKKYHKSSYANNIRGIFITHFKNKEQKSAVKIPLTQEIMAQVSKGFDGSIELATFKLSENNSNTLLTIEAKVISRLQPRRDTYENTSLCIDKNNQIIWWNLLQVNRGEKTYVRGLELKQGYQKEVIYTNLIYNDKYIKAYKVSCGNITTKIFKIPRKIQGYKFVSIDLREHRRRGYIDNNLYAKYKKGKKSMLVKLKTGKAFAEILD